MLSDERLVALREDAFEAMMAAHARHDVPEFVRQRARWQLYTELVEVRHPVTYSWDPGLHPRNRLGQFIEVLDMLTRAPRGSDIGLPEGFNVKRTVFGRHALIAPEKHGVRQTVKRGSPADILDAYEKERVRRRKPRSRIIYPAKIEALGGF